MTKGMKIGNNQPGSDQKDTQEKKNTQYPDKDAEGCMLQMVFHFETTLDEMVQQKQKPTSKQGCHDARDRDYCQ